jgi:hypothetical protein
LLDPGTPANLGGGCIEMLRGLRPTRIVAITVFVAMSITDTVPEFWLVT